jgi:hypothetical protein
MDSCRAGMWEEAWTQLDALNLLPRNEAELGVKVDFVFSKLDTSLKQHYHQVVLAGMETLYNQHRVIKEAIAPAQAAISAGGGAAYQQMSAVSAMEQRLVEIRNSARLVVTFAGLLQTQMLGDSNARIARMEAFMI